MAVSLAPPHRLQQRNQWLGRGPAFAVSLGALGLLLALPSGAAANFGAEPCPGFDDPFASSPVGCVSLGNNYTHTYQIVSVRADIAEETRRLARFEYNDRTDLSVYERDPADVIVMDNSYGPNGVAGWVNCPPTASQGGSGTARWCNGQYLRYNLYYPSEFDTIQERQHHACHEFGHTVGLQHTDRDDTCMNVRLRNTLLGAHDRAHVDSKYLPY